ncbi:MAG: hypothetical protein KKE62_10765 [Proteobacteria bacterium]|nr:hypothetical protein [Pseudomonadota bacterium]MBU1386698.1 hypothetical protein [Pseudomonadota bacterium]MBU1543309.1 hypothetical protein [Pseudomonadota bacterium]MBU2431017.1 hypothetical protein [Pseudomonadota bacterium]MBU2483140.1 hypothetical protein [Pseudomonadota bacterium]
MFKKIILISALFILLSLATAYALEQGEPRDTLSLKDIPFFEYDLKKKEGPKTYQLNLPVAIETQGLKGPLPLDNPVADYFWKTFKDSGISKAVEYNPGALKDYQNPYMRVVGVQSVGTPVKIKILAPALDEITMPLAGTGGKAGNVRYKAIKRIFSIRILDREGEMTLDKDKEKIKFVENNDALEISWIPSLLEEKRGPKLTAPIVLEINLQYKIRLESILDGKYLGGFFQEGWVERRVAWIAMPVCGMEFGKDDEPIACPATIAKGPSWKEYDLGAVSIQIPDNWDSRVKDGNAKFELGNEIAGITVVREEGGEKMIQYLKEKTEKKIKISGLDAIEYNGLVKDGKARAKLILFKDKPSDGKDLGIATVLNDDKYEKILEAALTSVTVDKGKAPSPDMAAIPTPHIPELSDLGKGDYSYSSENIPQAEYEPAQSAQPAKKEEEPADTKVNIPPEKQTALTGQDTDSGTVTLIKGIGDFVGRSETLQGDGSSDTHLKLAIQAPNKTITGICLRETGTRNAIWDTTAGNDRWLVAVTKKNKVLNQPDGTLQYTLGAGNEKLDLWLQDNHVIAAGKKELELVLSFDNNESLILPLKR